MARKYDVSGCRFFRYDLFFFQFGEHVFQQQVEPALLFEFTAIAVGRIFRRFGNDEDGVAPGSGELLSDLKIAQHAVDMVVPAMKPANDINLLACFETGRHHDEYRAVVVMVFHRVYPVVIPVAVCPAGIGEGSMRRCYTEVFSRLSSNGEAS